MGRILVVDDEPMVLRIVEKMLRVAGHEPDAYDRPAAALEAFSQEPDAHDLLVTDVMMPGMYGTELATKILEIRPDLQVVFITGYAPGPELQYPDLMSRFPVLSKPMQVPLLTATIDRLLSLPRGFPAGGVEAELYARVQEALAAVRRCQAEARAASTQCRAELQSADTHFALRRATERERRAMDRYLQVLAEWTRFVRQKRNRSGQEPFPQE